MLAAESAFTRTVGRPFGEGDESKDAMGKTNIGLKDVVVELMVDQYRPGEPVSWGEWITLLAALVPFVKA